MYHCHKLCSSSAHSCTTCTCKYHYHIYGVHVLCIVHTYKPRYVCRSWYFHTVYSSIPKILCTIDRERFAGLNVRCFSPIEVFTEILLRCLGHKCSLLRRGVYIHGKTFMCFIRIYHAGMLPLIILIGAKLGVYILEVASNSLLTS